MDKGIRQKSTKEWTHSLTAVPFVRGHRSVFPRTPRNTGVYTRHPTFVTATSGVLTRLPAKLSKSGMRVYTLSDRRSKKKIACLNGLRSEGVNYLMYFQGHNVIFSWYRVAYMLRLNSFKISTGTVGQSPGNITYTRHTCTCTGTGPIAGHNAPLVSLEMLVQPRPKWPCPLNP